MRRLVLALLVLSALIPAAAEARVGGQTTLSLSVDTQRELVGHGVSVRALRPATTNGVSFVFVRRGHRWLGGLKFAGNRRHLRVRHLEGSSFVRHRGDSLRLTGRGARLLNHVARAQVVQRGTTLGTVFSNVCRKPPCGRTRLGIFTPLVTNLVGFDDMVTEGRALGVGTLRFSQVVGTPARPAFSIFERSGMTAVPTVRSDPRKDAQGDNPAHPPTTPQALATFRTQLGTLLDSVPHPPVLMVENEQNATKFFAGTMAQYGQELEAAVEVAHARGVKVTDGGLTDQPVKLMVWQDYTDRGLTALADQYAARAFAPQPAIVRALQAKPFAGLPNAALQATWDRVKELIPILRRSAMDYVDFHFYTDDDQVLAEVIDYLRRAVGKSVVTTEIGQHDTDPAVVTGHLKTMVEDFRLPLVLWFDADGIPARGLHDAIGQLRPNGQAFKAFVAEHRELLR